MNIEAAVRWSVQQSFGQDEAVGDDDRRVGGVTREAGADFVRLEAQGRLDGKPGVQSKTVDGRQALLETAAGFTRRLRVDGEHAVSCFDNGLKGWQRKPRRAHEHEPKAHASAFSRLAALENFFITRSRFSRVRRSMNSTPFK